MREVLCLFFTISILASLSGCGDEEDEQEPPRVTYVSIGEGDIAPSYVVITVRFSKEMEWVEINVSEVAGITYLLTRNKAEWRVKWPRIPSPYDILSQTAYPWYGPIPEGSHTLMITGRDRSGEELEGFEPINFTVIPPGHSPPGIYGSECDPRDGATNVDPQQYKEKLVIGFNESMSEVKVLSTEPEFPYTAELIAEARKLIISFAQGYTMPEGTAFRIELVGVDLTNTAFDSWPEPEVYSFTTK
jgi:hypothetical protein